MIGRAAPLAFLLAACASAPPPAPVQKIEPYVRTPPPGPLPMTPFKPASAFDRVLPSGMRLVVIEHHRRPVVAIKLILAHGAAADAPDAAGRTYLSVALAGDFYELTADGKRYQSEESFRRKVANAGAVYSSEVLADYAMIGVSGFAKETPTYLKMLAESVAKPRHGPVGFSLRREDMLNALEDLERAEADAFREVISGATFGADHPYARTTLGTTAGLKTLSIEELIEHQKRVFTPDGATLLVVGDVAPAKVMAEVVSSFGIWKGPPRTDAPIPPAKLSRANEVSFIARAPSSALFTCATRSLPDVKASDAALDVLTALLGHGPAGKLDQSLREEHGLTYGAQAYMVRRRYARAFMACARLKGDASVEGVRLFKEALEAVKTSPPTSAELDRAKNIAISRLETSTDSMAESERSWLDALSLGRLPKIAEQTHAIAQVTPEEIQTLAGEIFDASRIHWILAGERSHASKAVEGNQLGRLVDHRIVR